MPTLLLLLVCLWSSSALFASDDAIIPEAASTIGNANSVSAQHFMAVTANPLATQAAVDILRRGGSAIDATIAAQWVLGLVEPQASGLGGGAFMLYWDQPEQQLHFYDGRETAPVAVDDKLFVQENGQPLNFLDAVIGGRSVGVPGVVKLLALSHQRHGKLPWAELFQPAIKIAENGFAISPRLHTLLAETPRLAVNPAIKSYFFQADGSPKPIGFKLKNPSYAKTLKLLAQQGEKGFYSGAIARDIVQAVQHNPSQSGKLALADLKAYQARERPPLCGQFLQYKVCGPAPPSSGGSTVLAILGILAQLPPEQLTPQSPNFYHLFSEASRLAAADRDTYIADPDFVAVPSENLIAPSYLAQRAALIDLDRTMAEVRAGQLERPLSTRINYITSQSPELISTSQVSIVDASGNAVSMTTSVETAFGSRLLVDGFLLNNQLTDFSFVPRTTDNQLVANRVEPGKRPRSSMAPVIVFKEGKPVLILGSPGGARIIDYVAKTLTYVLEGELSLTEAIASPHITDMGHGTELESGRIDNATRANLIERGHAVTDIPQTSGLNGIVIETQQLHGVSDPRREGTAAGG